MPKADTIARGELLQPNRDAGNIEVGKPCQVHHLEEVCGTATEVSLPSRAMPHMISNTSSSRRGGLSREYYPDGKPQMRQNGKRRLRRTRKVSSVSMEQAQIWQTMG
ncbi:MAG TPA: hypothetical protein DEV93_05925 [Chloroflexi bacterium]|nr:hypothetical protein [Chloroflexota bacterium]